MVDIMTSQQQVVVFFLSLSLVSLTPTLATVKECSKEIYITANHESFVDLNLSEDEDCNQLCPDMGDEKLEINRVEMTSEDSNATIYWNKNSILIKVPKNSVLISGEHATIEMTAHYMCVLPDGQMTSPLKITITFLPVELELKQQEDQVIEDTPLHVTCKLKGHTESAEVEISIHHRNKTINTTCPQSNSCEYDTPRADLVKDSGYYFCRASIKNNSINLHHRCESNDLYVNITRNKEKERTYFGLTIGVPVGTCLLIIVATIIIITTIVVRRRRPQPGPRPGPRPGPQNHDNEVVGLLAHDVDQHRGYGGTGQESPLHMSDRSSDTDTPSPQSTPPSSITPIPDGAQESETTFDGYESNRSKSSKESVDSKPDDAISLVAEENGELSNV